MKQRILVTDDDRLVLATIQKALQQAGYEVSTAERGSEALTLAQESGFDLAIMDIQLPDASGVDIARQLFQEHEVPCLFLSAYSEPETVSQAISTGALGYVVKPVDAPQLIPAVEAALARARDMYALLSSKSHLENALNKRRGTNIAIGILMERRRLSQQDAFDLLRNEARSSNQKLEDLCRGIVESIEQVNRV